MVRPAPAGAGRPAVLDASPWSPRSTASTAAPGRPNEDRHAIVRPAGSGRGLRRLYESRPRRRVDPLGQCPQVIIQTHARAVRAACRQSRRADSSPAWNHRRAGCRSRHQIRKVLEPRRTREDLSLAFSPDGNRLAAGVANGPGAAGPSYGTSQRRPLSAVAAPGYQLAARLVALNPDGRHLATSRRLPTADSLERGRWSRDSSVQARRRISLIAFSPRGDLLAALTSTISSSGMWPTGAARTTISRQMADPSTTTSIRLGATIGASPSPSARMAVTWRQGPLAQSERGTGRIRRRCSRHGAVVGGRHGRQVLLMRGRIGRAYSPTLARMAGGWPGVDGTMESPSAIWAAPDAMSLSRRGAVAVSPDGSLVACCDGQVHIYDTAAAAGSTVPWARSFSGLGWVSRSLTTASGCGRACGRTGMSPSGTLRPATRRMLKAEGPAFGMPSAPMTVSYVLNTDVAPRLRRRHRQPRLRAQSQDKIYCGAFNSDGSRLASGGIRVGRNSPF